MARVLRFLACLGVLGFASISAGAEPLDTAALDEIIRTAMKAWKVPGAALAIVRGEEPAYLQGYGVRDQHETEPVTPDTLFAIASCTKAFTATAIAILIDEGKMAWDDPVCKHIDFFHLADPLADAKVTLRDLLSHRTGLSRHDWLWYKSPWGQEEILKRIGSVKANKDFRSAYQYQNIMYLAAGYAAGRASGGSWEQLVRQRLFEPLGMKTANFSTKDLEKALNRARPHVKGKDGTLKVEPFYNIDHMGPAGSINASVRDLVPWLRFQLGDGAFAGKRLVRRKNFEETHLPQTIIRLEGREKSLNPESLQKSYGLGWLVQDFRGQPQWSHTGGLDGFRCRIVIIPQEKLALALLTNSDVGTSGASMHTAATNMLVEKLLDMPRRDWNAYYTELADKFEAEDKADKEKRRAKRQKGTKPSLELSAYAGTYDDPGYGPLEIVHENGALQLRWSGFRQPLEHFHFDTFTVKADDEESLDGEELLFRLDAKGEVESLQFLNVTFTKRLAAARRAAR